MAQQSSTRANDSTTSRLPFIFDRPSEPLFTGREDVNFDIPNEFWPDRYKAIAATIQTRFPATGDVVRVQKFSGQTPDLSQVIGVGRRSNFSIFNPNHRSCAVKLIEIFMNAPNVDQFLSTCVYARERVNPYLFTYAASVAILHRPDTRSIQLPAHCELFPKLYMDSGIFGRAVEQAAVIPEGQRVPIEIPRDYTATDLDDEHRIAYWREDVGINLHHWHWHLVYPFDGPRNIVNKDRRGEIFYYMHEQIQARYNFERLCNGMSRVRRMNNFRDPMPEAYFPKLDSGVASRNFPARQPNSVLEDLNREPDQIRIDVATMERWRDRILNAIQDGYVTDGQRNIQLTETEGTDILGNLLEASSLSVNRNVYGDLHNSGHMMLGYTHDPDGRFLESFGIIADPTTAMRDPVFYAFHAFINDIFVQFKNTLTPYTQQQLAFDGIRINEIEVITEGAQNNTFLTFWQQNDINLSRGMDFQQRGNVYARLTHLQHAPFTYRIRVENSGQQRLGTCRIFMAPRNDERGSAFLFRDQRLLFIELDKFTVTLRSGSNTIERRSIESNVTIPFEQTFRDLSNRPTSATVLESYNYCGCGWPDHVLIPRGNNEGYTSDLFVMISDNSLDVVQQTGNVSSTSGCDDAQSYCGLRGGRYPDRRAMGYPFDRNARLGVNTLQQFVSGNTNMLVQSATIRYSNRLVPTSGSRGTSTTSSVRPQSGSTSTGRPQGGQFTGQTGGRPQGGQTTSQTGGRPQSETGTGNPGRPGGGFSRPGNFN